MSTYNVDLQDYDGNSYRVMANPDSVAEFTPAAERRNISSGETHRTVFGKIAKNLADLKTVAFSGSYTDLANKPTIPAGAAANYPVANNDTTNNAGYLVTAQVAYQHGQEIDKLNRDLVSNVNAITTVWLGSTKISFDGTNFYATAANGVKKKLGSKKTNEWTLLAEDWFGQENLSGFQALGGYIKEQHDWNYLLAKAYDVKSLRADYQSLTASDFTVTVSSFLGHNENNGHKNDKFTLPGPAIESYDAGRGILTVTCGYYHTEGPVQSEAHSLCVKIMCAA